MSGCVKRKLNWSGMLRLKIIIMVLFNQLVLRLLFDNLRTEQLVDNL